MKTALRTLTFLLALSSSALFADTLISNSNGFGFSATTRVGQSFTLASGFDYEITGFKWLNTSPNGVVYLFDQIYTGTANNIASAPTLLATSQSFASGQFSFSTPIHAVGGATFYVYATSGYQISLDSTASYLGGTFYSAGSGTSAFTASTLDSQFAVLGTATASAIPEPSTYSAIAGFVALGLAAWKRHAARRV